MHVDALAVLCRHAVDHVTDCLGHLFHTRTHAQKQL